MEGVMIASGGMLSDFSAKPGSRGGSRIGRVTKLVKPFWPVQEGGLASEAQKEAVSEGMSIKHSRYSERRIEKGMEAIIENLRKEPEGTWVSRVTLKQRSRSSVGDTGLLNFSLRCVENRRVGDSMVVRRSIHPVSQVMAYRLERIDSNAQEHAPVCEERRVLEPKVQAPRVGGSVEGKKDKGGKPKPVRRKKEAALTEERSMSKEEREEAEFEEGLSTLFALGGEIRPLPAMVDGQAVNLMLLFQHVACNGGYEEVSKRREWNVVAAQLGLKLEAGSCLKLLHAKYLHDLETLLGHLAPPPPEPRRAPLDRLKTRSSSTCTSEGHDESEWIERTTLPSLQAVSEGSLGQQLRCTETEATSSACSLKVEEDAQPTPEEREAVSRGCDEKDKGTDLNTSGGSRLEGALLDLGPETSVEGSLLTDVLPALQTVGEKRILADLEVFGAFVEPLPLRKSGVYGSGAVCVVNKRADVAASQKHAFSDVSGSADVAAPQKRAISDVSGSADLAASQKRARSDSCAGMYHAAAVPTSREQDGGANVLKDDEPAQQIRIVHQSERRQAGSAALRNMQALTLSIQEPDNLGPQDASAIVGFCQPEPVAVKPKTLSPQRLKLIPNPSPRKMLSPRTVQPSPQNLTLSPTKWIQSLNGQKRKASDTPEQKRSKEVATGHPLKRPRCYLPLTTFAEPVSPHLTRILTALQELLVRHRESVEWQEGLGARFEFPEGRRTRKKQVEEELEYIPPRIGSRYQAQVPEWNPKAADVYMTSELDWIGQPVLCPVTADAGPKRPTLKRLNSQPDARKHLISEARNQLEVAVGAAGADLGLLEMGECVARKWTRGQEQRFLLTAASIPRGEAMGEEFYGEGYFRALSCTLPEKSLAELVSYYYNVYKVRCKRQDGGSKWAVEKMAPEGGAVAMFTSVEHTGVA